MLRLLRSEVFRLRHRWMPWVLLLMVVAVGFGFYFLVYYSAQAQLQAVQNGTAPAQPGATEAMQQALRELRPDRVADFGVSIITGIGAVMLIVFAASHVGTEYGWGTLRTLLAHGAGRGGFLAAKLAALAMFAVAFLTVGTIAAIAGSYAVSAIAGSDTGGFDLSQVASAAAIGYYTFLPYLALAAVIAVWARSGGAGIAAGLVVYFAESLIASILVQLNRDFATIVNYGLSRNVSALTRVTVRVSTGVSAGGNGAAALPDPGQAALVLAGYTILFVALAYWRLRTRDVTVS